MFGGVILIKGLKIDEVKKNKFVIKCVNDLNIIKNNNPNEFDKIDIMDYVEDVLQMDRDYNNIIKLLTLNDLTNAFTDLDEVSNASDELIRMCLTNMLTEIVIHNSYWGVQWS